MRFARYIPRSRPEAVPRWAVVEGRVVDGRAGADTVLIPIEGDPMGQWTLLSALQIPLSKAKLLPPCVPSKVVGIGTNYHAHAIEMGRALPAVPKMFLMPTTAVIGSGDPIELPPGSERVDHEAELAVIIGRRASRVSPADARSYVWGYTACNDVTARDFQKQDGVFARAKGFDSFCPLGPWVVTGLDPSDLRVRGLVDGTLRQDGRTSDLIFDVPTLVSFVSHVMTLLPGDVISTGTPSGVGPLVAGETVRVMVEGIGTLENPVVHRPDRSGPVA